MTAVPALEALPESVRGLADYALLARSRLDPGAWSYIEAAAGDGLAQRRNQAAWDALALWPRVLQPLDGHTSSVTLLDRPWPTPLLVAPMALQKLAHADGELATALAAAAQGAGMILSTQTSVPMEAVAAAVRSDPQRGPLWFQLYLQRDAGATLELVRRAEAAGYEALVLTVDAGIRAAHGTLRLPSGVAAVHLQGDAGHAGAGAFATAPTWNDVTWLLQQTRLPVLLKGVLHPADACEAVRCGVRGIIVSNHGGRTLDAAVATATALPRVADAVAGSTHLLVDGGVRRGSDVLKALALGADAVLVGRPALHGLAVAGAAGVAHVLRLLRDELTIAMAQCGLRCPADASRALLGEVESVEAAARLK